MSVKRSFATHLIPPDCDPATLLPQSSKYLKSADLLRKSLLSHIWSVPSSNALSCKHERLFDLLTLVSLYFIIKKAVKKAILETKEEIIK